MMLIEEYKCEHWG